MVNIRFATKEDMPAVWSLVYELAVYEKAPEEVITSPDSMVRDGFGENPSFRCLVAEDEHKIILGIALYYFAYSTWKGRIMYLDDLVVTEASRQAGIGQKLMDKLTEIAREESVAQMRWHVLEWNKPAIRFYEKLGASLDAEWIQCKFYP